MSPSTDAHIIPNTPCPSQIHLHLQPSPQLPWTNFRLERQEAFRRAEYEARHAEALRRAKTQTRQLQSIAIEPHPRPQLRHRVSKSATTSPIMRNALPLSASATDDRNFFIHSGDRDYDGPPLSASSSRPSAEDLQRDLQERDSVRIGSKRRLSGPAWMAPPQPPHETPLVQSRSSGHLVETMRSAGAHSLSHHGGTFSHPYHHPHQYRHLASSERGVAHGHDDSPSPISSDSEPLPAHERVYASQSPPRIFHLHGAGGRSHGSAHLPRIRSTIRRHITPLLSERRPHPAQSLRSRLRRVRSLVPCGRSIYTLRIRQGHRHLFFCRRLPLGALT
ncbi:hypothetical protein BDZ97DRAFT_571793 [Flammula alnicola]|nr:hypothetical protein BDZ97DRAFT_571793 [Flammula alnicola]